MGYIVTTGGLQATDAHDGPDQVADHHQAVLRMKGAGRGGRRGLGRLVGWGEAGKDHVSLIVAETRCHHPQQHAPIVLRE